MPDASSHNSPLLPGKFLRRCRAQRSKPKVADSSGIELTGGQLLLRTFVLRRLLSRLIGPDEKYVGLLVPPCVPAVVANAALPLMGRIAVNLNYTLHNDTLNNCIEQAGIRHVLTSHRVLEKFPFKLNAELIFLEDLPSQVTWRDKLVAAVQAFAMPVPLLERQLGLRKIKSDDVLTVIFTSGSTGEPKGVMLTYDNIGTNVAAINALIRLTDRDVALGVLPFFHSFGYMATLWTILSLDPKGVYHTNPTEAQQVGKLCEKHGVTVLMGTPTFFRMYIKRCTPEQFKHLDVVVAGAEKLPRDLSDAFEAKFGVRPCEGYGTTELSPLVAVNVPASRATEAGRVTAKDGTVGRPIPGVEARIVHPETNATLGVGQEGLLLIRGPNVMKGYLNKPDKTASVIRDGWYVTGDMARIDSDGFIEITGRESRFSKIGGEMVPHIKIEETLQKVLGGETDGELKAVVTSVPDERKGERLIVVHTALDRTPQEICKALAEAGLPALWVPSPDSFLEVQEIPVLGTGKLDLKGLSELAKARFAGK